MPQPVRRPASLVRRLVLLALLGVGALLIAPCKMVDDQLVGVSLHRDSAGRCYAKCAKEYAQDLAKETKRHIEALRACCDDRDCREMERERFKQKLAELKEEARQCRDECHHQGHGGGR